jgi:hypothetical protein
MKLILTALIVLITLPAYSASVSLTAKNWYSQSYMTTSTVVPTQEQMIDIKVDSIGAGEVQMPTRNYSFAWNWDYSNDVRINQKVRVQSAFSSCQIIFESVMSVRYCSAKKLQSGEDCNVIQTVTKRDTFACTDLMTQRVESTVKYDIWETLKNGADLRYAFSNSVYARDLKFHRNQ